MPIQQGKDSQGPYYKWGRSGKKYHYSATNKSSKSAAKSKAKRQGRAIHARQGR